LTKEARLDVYLEEPTLILGIEEGEIAPPEGLFGLKMMDQQLPKFLAHGFAMLCR
jgi:hypothetical protein